MKKLNVQESLDSEVGPINSKQVIKSLTLQHPNERELKNEVRWIYGWNLWTELVRQSVNIFIQHPDAEADGVIETGGKLCNLPRQPDAKETLLMELRSHIVTKSVQTLSKVKTIRRIKEIGVKVDVWEIVRREAVDLLTELQILSCEYKAAEQPPDNPAYLKTLENYKHKVLCKIVTISENIDFHYKEMQLAVDTLKNFRCHGLFVDPVAAKTIDKYYKRIVQPFQLPGLTPLMSGSSVVTTIISTDSNSPPPTTTTTTGYNTTPTAEDSAAGDAANPPPSSKKTSSKSKRSSELIPDVPDFCESLFSGMKLPGKKNRTEQCQLLDKVSTKDSAGHYVHIILRGTEWYLAWSQFTEKVLREIKNLAPALGSEVVTYMTKHINQQITTLKSLLVEVRSLSEKLRKPRLNEMSTMYTCLSAVDDFVNLIESIKHEASYLIRYTEIALINLGVLDLNKEPVQLQPLRLYLIRNVIAMKDCHLLSSIDYLYLEMGKLLEFVEYRFHSDRMYLELFGPVTADLLKKYTKHRKEAIQEREFENLQSVDKEELEKELGDVPGKSPLSRYQRAEDVRRWVEQSKMIAMSSATKEDSTYELAHVEQDASEESWGSALDGLDSDQKARPVSSFWKATKCNAHSLSQDLKKRLSLKKSKKKTL